MPGRKPLPTSLKVFRGTAQKCRINPHEPKPPVAAPEPPDFLGPIARREWERKVPLLVRLGVMSEVDDTALAAYCQAFERFVEAERKIRNSGLLIKTTGGNVIQNPLVGVANRAMEIMHKFLTEFGLTPASRTRITAVPHHQQHHVWEEFGPRVDESQEIIISWGDYTIPRKRTQRIPLPRPDHDS